jgi:hypothetical protein
MSFDRRAHVDVGGGARVDEPALDCLVGDELGVDAMAVVADFDDHAAAGVTRRDLERADRRFAGGAALGRRLESVIEGVAHQVHERVAQGVDDGAVQLRVGAHELELDLLAQLVGEVADQAGKAQEHDLDRDHAYLHDHGLQRLGAASELLHGLVKAGNVER